MIQPALIKPPPVLLLRSCSRIHLPLLLLGGGRGKDTEKINEVSSDVMKKNVFSLFCQISQVLPINPRHGISFLRISCAYFCLETSQI